MSLSARENFQNMMSRRGMEWIPLDLPMTPPVIDRLERELGTRDPARAFDLDIRSFGTAMPVNAAAWREALTELGEELPANAEVWEFGCANLLPPKESVGEAYHFRTMLHPLRHVTSVEQLEALPWPDFNDESWYARPAARIEQIHAEGKVAQGTLECTIFEFSWYARGMDNLYCDLIDGNGIGDWLLDWHTARSARAVAAFAAAGADVIALGDDIGTQRGMMMSAEFWREHLKPRLKRVIDAVRAHQRRDVWVKYHSDGDIREVIGDLVEIGVDILNPVQPECMPLDEVIPAWKDRLGFWGMIGTQTTMPFGTPADVRAAVDAAARWAGEGAAVVIAPTHVLEPDVPWENIVTLVEAVKAARPAAVRRG